MLFRLLALLALVSCAAAVSAQTVNGLLSDPNGAPHAGALVVYESGQVGPGVIDSTRTDADGRFRLTGVAGAGGMIGVYVGDRDLWVPFVPSDPSGDRTLGLVVTAPLAGEWRVPLDGFAATSDDATLADLMTAYVAAERLHRTPPPTPALDSLRAEVERRIAAAPNRQQAIEDSARAVAAPLVAALARELAARADAYAALAEGETRPLVRAGYALWALDKVTVDSARAAAVLATVPPDSPLWSSEAVSRVGVSRVLGRAVRELVPEGSPIPADVEAYLRTMAFDHPDPEVQLQASYALTYVLDEPAASAVRSRITRDFPDSWQAEEIRRDYGTDRLVQPGRPLPDFAYPSLDDPAVLVSNADLAGRTVLLDFWGTWCGPCIDALPRLHALRERFRDDGFEIVSVAVGDTAEDVAAFRAERFPMPWVHAVHPEDTTSEAGADLEFNAIPAYVLVGPDGVVIAEGEGAFTDEIEAAVAAHFGSD